MIRKFLMPALLAGTLAGCATGNYYYRDAGYGGGYYYGEPTVDYDYYGGYGGYGYGWWGWPYYSAWYGPYHGFPYSHWDYPYYWPYYGDGYWSPHPGRGDEPLVEKQGNDIRHLRRVDGANGTSDAMLLRREGGLTEKRGGQPRILRQPRPMPDPGMGPPRQDGVLTERRGGEPRVLRQPQPMPDPGMGAPRPQSNLADRGGGEPRVLRQPERTAEPRAMRAPEPRTAPRSPPMRAPSSRGPGTVSRRED